MVTEVGGSVWVEKHRELRWGIEPSSVDTGPTRGAAHPWCGPRVVSGPERADRQSEDSFAQNERPWAGMEHGARPEPRTKHIP